jgi:hypothetical protein
MTMSNMFRDSARTLRRVPSLTAAGMLLGVQIVLNLITSIPLGPSIRISFGYLALASAGAMM